MAEQLKISINQPCGENFNAFKTTKAGGFCQSCQKEVVDFTKMTDAEIVNYFKNSRNAPCGRFKTSQLKEYTLPTPPQSSSLPAGLGLLGVSLLSLLPLTANAQAEAPKIAVLQEQPFQTTDHLKKEKTEPGDSLTRGKITDILTGETIPLANIILKDTLVGTSTDFDGEFTFPVPLKKGDVLVISFTGYETLEYTVGEDDFLRIEMVEGGNLLGNTVVIMGSVSTAQPHTAKRSFWDKLKSFFR